MAASGPVGVGFIGTGMISDTYLENLDQLSRRTGGDLG